MSEPTISKPVYVGGVVLCIATSLGLILASMQGRGGDSQALLLLTLVPMLLGAIFLGSLFYRMWAAIQDGHARTTPGKALGLLLVPFYNFYWAFQVLPGFAEDYNRYVLRHDIAAPPLSVGLLRAYVMLCLSSLVPVIGVAFALVNAPLTPVMVAAICDAINALRAASTGRRGGFQVSYEAEADMAGSLCSADPSAERAPRSAERASVVTSVSASYAVASGVGRRAG